MRRTWLVLGAACTLAGCATFAPPPGAPPSPADRSPRSTVPAGAPGASQRPTSSAATSLLEQGRADRAAGRYGAAAAAVERALGIEPNDPRLWLELAEIKLAEGNAAQAEVMARKALTLAAGDPAIERRALRLID